MWLIFFLARVCDMKRLTFKKIYELSNPVGQTKYYICSFILYFVLFCFL